MEYTLKKSFGQHFLHDEVICKKIVSLIDDNNTSWLEIGPGAGALTQYLLQYQHIKFKCIELDIEKANYLLKKYPLLQNKLQQADFLKSNLPYQGSFNIIGNFPYNISSQIVFKILEWSESVYEVIGMFQKEVAERICAIHGNKTYGILSVLVQNEYDVSYQFDVQPEAFTPPPKVMSGVIRLIKKEQAIYKGDIQKFRLLVKTAFSQRRKTLRNCLKQILPADHLQDSLFDKRAEQLSVQDFADLCRAIYG